MRTITQQEHENMVNFWVQNAREVTIDRVLEIIDDVEHTEGLSKADEYGLLRMLVKELRGEKE